MRTKLRENERVNFWTRKHWIVLFRPLLVFISAIAFMILLITTEPSETPGDFKELLEKLLIITAVGAAIYLVYSFFDRRFNIWIVTNLRVVDEWGVLSHNAKENALDKIHNVSYRQTITGRILGYGNIEIQTAAEQGSTVSTFVTSPKEFHGAIVNSQENYREEEKRIKYQIRYDDEDRVDCPHCAERVKAKAIVCRFCGRDIEKEETQAHKDKIIPDTPRISLQPPGERKQSPPVS